MMHWPWEPTPPKEQPTRPLDAVVTMARHERGRSKKILDLLFPAIDPNDVFAPPRPDTQEETAECPH